MSRTNDKKHIMPQGTGETEVCLRQILAGVEKHMSATSKWRVGRETYGRAELEKELGALVQIFAGPREAEALFHRLTAERDGRASSVAEFLKDMLTTLEYQLGRESAALEDFGFRAPKKRAELSADAKAQAVARGLATKAKNGTIKPRNQEKPAA